MTDEPKQSGSGDKKEKRDESTSTKTVTWAPGKAESEAATAAAAAQQQPPLLEAACRRLERLLGGGTLKAAGTAVPSSTSSSKPSPTTMEESTLPHSNPGKIVKRWLGTSSGTAAKATLVDVIRAAKTLLDPEGICATGRDLLVNLSSSTDVEMEIDDDNNKKEGGGDDKQDSAGSSSSSSLGYLSASVREVEAYLLSLATRLLWRAQKFTEAFELSGKGINILYTHLETSSQIVGSAGAGVNTTSLYPLLARMHRYQSLAAESLPNKHDVIANMRQEMVKAHRMACLRRDVDTQATLLNLLLRDLINASQVEQAQKLLSNSTFPTESVSNNQLCRYLYHSGRIQALRLEYTSAFSNLSQCLRKSPTNTGLGFRIATQRLLIVVQLLMGEIPERTIFFTEGMVKELEPYLRITQAVRRGDLAVFRTTVSQCSTRLKEDGTYTLISRLAHSVVKAGLRKLNISYSRISLDDVAHRLGLTNSTSAEFVVAKAIRDGVIDATIDHSGKYVQSHDLIDVYATTEPAEAFHRRIAYCLTTHNDAVRGMRYPPDAYKKQLEASRGLRGKGKDDEKTDEERAQELEDELDEDY